jgi:hypothetical protein
VLGAEFVSLRVCNGWLEQKSGIFQPEIDQNCPSAATDEYAEKTGWAPLLANVEDFQVAYIFHNGEIWNNSPNHQLGSTGQVPTQGTPANPYDAANIAGLRVNITVRSPVAAAGEPASARYSRPESEDHEAGTTKDAFPRYQASAMAMLRNRNPRG